MKAKGGRQRSVKIKGRRVGGGWKRKNERFSFQVAYRKGKMREGKGMGGHWTLPSFPDGTQERMSREKWRKTRRKREKEKQSLSGFLRTYVCSIFDYNWHNKLIQNISYMTETVWPLSSLSWSCSALFRSTLFAAALAAAHYLVG